MDPVGHSVSRPPSFETYSRSRETHTSKDAIAYSAVAGKDDRQAYCGCLQAGDYGVEVKSRFSHDYSWGIRQRQAENHPAH
jgi:hypothetical protein